MTPLEMFSLLILGHAIADYPLQGDFLARAKNRQNPIAGVPWYQAMAAHSVIHGGLVGIATGSILCGAAEFIVHCLIDDTKCAGRLSYNADQALHIACKAVWVVVIFYGSRP